MSILNIKTIRSAFLFVITGLFITACSTVEDVAGTLNEETQVDPSSPLYRLWNCAIVNGQLHLAPVTPGSVTREKVHVITHGWAPGYLTAVENYKKKTGRILLAWEPEAVDGSGDRFFVEPFFPLVEAILNADPGSTVLVYSWIDQSATGDFGACTGEKHTQEAASELREAMQLALDQSSNHRVHLLGHSFGTKVVSTIKNLAHFGQQDRGGRT